MEWPRKRVWLMSWARTAEHPSPRPGAKAARRRLLAGSGTSLSSVLPAKTLRPAGHSEVSDPSRPPMPRGKHSSKRLRLTGKQVLPLHRGNPAGEIAFSDVFNAVRDVTGVRKIGDRPEDFLLNDAREDLAIGSRQSPTLGRVTLTSGDTGLAL
jgi:hypothetical protein